MSTAASPPTIDDLRSAWDAIAPGFDQYVTDITTELAELLLDDVEIGPGARLLDVGAGSGAVALAAARRGAEVLAVDLAPTMIQRLEARARDAGLSRLQARVMDGHALDLDDNQFDVATSLNGVSLFPNAGQGLRELVRTVRPGGQIAIGTFGAMERAEFIAWPIGALVAVVPDFTPPGGGQPLPPFRWADPETFAAALAGVGGRDVEVRTVTWDTKFDSADHLIDVLTNSNPIGAQTVSEVDPSHIDEVRKVLEGMLRERSGGPPSAILQTEIHIGTATV